MRDGLTFCHLHWQNFTVGSSFRLYYLPGKAFMEIFSLASAFFGWCFRQKTVFKEAFSGRSGLCELPSWLMLHKFLTKGVCNNRKRTCQLMTTWHRTSNGNWTLAVFEKHLIMRVVAVLILSWLVHGPFVSADSDTLVTDRAYLDISIGGEAKGRIVIALFGKTVPKTVKNFRALASHEVCRSYLSTRNVQT